MAPFARAQSERVRRIGILVPSAYGAGMIPGLSRRLAELGWVEGRNLSIEVRDAGADLQRLPALAAELVRLQVDLLVTVTTPATRVVKAAAGTIPAVFSWVGDPVAAKFVASLARPGGTVTGLTQIQSDIAPKQIELLKALIPGLTRVAQLYDPKYAGGTLNASWAEAAANARITLVQVAASSPAEFEQAFASAAREQAKAMLIPPLPLYADHSEGIARLAKQFRIPAAGQMREFAAAGGLVSYGANLGDGFLRMAPYIDRILRGAKPSELPVEQAARFDIVVNRKTAAELGLTVPPVVLLQATEVIE